MAAALGAVAALEVDGAGVAIGAVYLWIGAAVVGAAVVGDAVVDVAGLGDVKPEDAGPSDAQPDGAEPDDAEAAPGDGYGWAKLSRGLLGDGCHAS